MSKQRFCRQCGQPFTYTRDDKQFDSPACVAKFYRENPNPQYIHAANMDEYWHECEFCGVEFYVNGYADRGGKRAPKYHSVACKQAAYRARGKANQQQAARRSTADNGAAPKSSGSGNTKANRQQAGSQQQQQQQSAPPPPPPPPAQKQPPAPQWKYVGTKGKSNPAMIEALNILGLVYGQYQPDEVRKAYKRCMVKWHPDKNPSPHATAWAQAINWAYEYLK